MDLELAILMQLRARTNNTEPRLRLPHLFSQGYHHLSSETKPLTKRGPTLYLGRGDERIHQHSAAIKNGSTIAQIVRECT